jgi:hypothetical protein
MYSVSGRLPTAIYSTRKTVPTPPAQRKPWVGTRGARPAAGLTSCSGVPSLEVQTAAPMTHFSWKVPRRLPRDRMRGIARPGNKIWLRLLTIAG